MSFNEILVGGGPKVSDNDGPSLYSRVRRVVVIIVLICCVLVAPCCGQNNLLTCGKRQGINSQNSNFAALRIQFGKEAGRGDWPWHASVYLTAGNKPKYACGGSILNRNTIISSAHCFVAFNQVVQEEHITVHVGQIDLTDTIHDVQKLNASKLIIHPNFQIRSNLQYDIAIVKLATDIVMSSFIYPVCLWDMNYDYRQLVGKTGTIVGFGLDENDQMSIFLQAAELTVVDTLACIDNNRESHGRVLTSGMYCAGGEPGVSGCNGDSGGGMFFEKDDTWYIGGIISFIANRPNTNLCDSSKYTVFTDVGEYLEWIKPFISESPAPSTTAPLEPCKEGTIRNGSMFTIVDHFLLVASFSKIVRVPLNGGQSFSVTRAKASGLDSDCAEGRLYWSVEKNIHSAKYDGTDRKPFITTGAIDPKGVAVDWISRRLYWYDWVKETIEVASLEDPNVRTVLISKGLDRPGAIAVDPLQGKLYWTNGDDAKQEIEWSNLDGTGRQVLVSYPLVRKVKSLQISICTGELCYTDDGTKNIACINPSSKQIRTIASNLSDPRVLAVTDELFYWTAWNKNAINSINQKGERQKPLAFGLNYESYGMAAVTDKCPLFYSPCAINNGECPVDTICLFNPSAPASRSCVVKMKCKNTDDCRALITN